MAVTVQMQFESVVTEIYQDAFVGSSIENGTTIIQFDLRKHNFQQALGTQATLCWRKESYHVDVHELSTFHNPILYRFISHSTRFSGEAPTPFVIPLQLCSLPPILGHQPHQLSDLRMTHAPHHSPDP